MNERLKELMKQADYPAPELAKRAQKLVELIVLECADVCQRFGGSGDGYTCSAEILEHFEIKE